MGDVVDTVIKLARMASSDEEHEAHTHAMTACKLIRENEGSFRPSSGASQIHPNAARRIEWQRFTHQHSISFGTDNDGTCAACGEDYLSGTNVYYRDGVTTHEHCKDWWFGVDFVEMFNEIPF